jgi:hypothetical protein
VSDDELDRLPRVELYRIARDRGISDTIWMTREELIAALRSAPPPVAAPTEPSPVATPATPRAPSWTATPRPVRDPWAIPRPPGADAAREGPASPERPAPVVPPSPPARTPASLRPLLFPAVVGAATAGVLVYLLDPFGRR